jgi:hypothetical protein
MIRIRLFCSAAILLMTAVASADEPKKVEAKVKEIAGVAEFLRGVPKHFAQLKAVDRENRRVTLLIEGDTVAKTWDLMPDAEVKFHGWWGRLEQFNLGDRVWVWFQTDRQKQPISVMMIADELSEQDIHDVTWTALEISDMAKLHPSKGADRSLQFMSSTLNEGAKKGERAYFQSRGDKADLVRLILGVDAFEQHRSKQREWLAKRWTEQGLPGAVTFLHQLSGEMELMLDHEAMRWARSLKAGASITIDSIKGVVREANPWRERTRVRLVVAALDQADMRVGQRIHMKMTPPSSAIQQSPLPPDIGLRKDRHERIEWFLASIYCTCLVRGNICTGHFYTLASCNPNGCGQPNMVRKQIGQYIDEGKSDEQIFDSLVKEYGPGLLKPHLLQ